LVRIGKRQGVTYRTNYNASKIITNNNTAVGIAFKNKPSIEADVIISMPIYISPKPSYYLPASKPILKNIGPKKKPVQALY
jgi:hypothetical protein